MQSFKFTYHNCGIKKKTNATSSVKPLPSLFGLQKQVLLNSNRPTCSLKFFMSLDANYIELTLSVEQVAVHQPWELPSAGSHHFLLLPLSHSLHVAVTPRLVTSASTPSTPCLSQHESPLLTFSRYSRGNCLLECRAECSLSLCGCVSLHLPRQWCCYIFQLTKLYVLRIRILGEIIPAFFTMKIDR